MVIAGYSGIFFAGMDGGHDSGHRVGLKQKFEDFYYFSEP